MIRNILLHYLINGKSVGRIAEELGTDRAGIRASLKNGGINLRPTANGYALGRDPVCDAVRRNGYPSFHYFAQCMTLESSASQAEELGVTEKALSKVYNSYRSLLTSLQADGVSLPTSQISSDHLD